MSLLSNKTALVTGASRGIGRAIAVTLAQHGAYVGINFHRSQEAARETLHQVQRTGEGMLLPADVSQEKEVESMVGDFVEAAGRIHIVVNNAGIYQRASFDELEREQWRRILGVNLDGAYHVTRHALPHVPEQGRIVFISSQLAFKGSSHGTDYAASKAGMLGMARSLARELAPRRITVNVVAPGTIDTDMIGGYTQEQKRERASLVPLGRLGTPQDVAYACLFLASPWADYITGETINVNGGLYIH
ncbi:MAG: SDR family NAD(P)-dependent oxidoreductase [Candidatus Thermoplasmatota archaeon]|nr:SDR family NAD(P)-dependent oxidoreductase [Candidatus Thermoplasmatota archaeon]